MDLVMDRSYIPPTATGRISMLKEFLNQSGLIDAWRCSHPVDKQYSFFSGAHRFFSRIDLILMSGPDSHRIVDTAMLARGLSDHSPVTLTLTLGSHCPNRRWRLNTWQLKSATVSQHIKETLDQYFQDNRGSVDSNISLWEAMKPTLRVTLLAMSLELNGIR